MIIITNLGTWKLRFTTATDATFKTGMSSYVNVSILYILKYIYILSFKCMYYKYTCKYLWIHVYIYKCIYICINKYDIDESNCIFIYINMTGKRGPVTTLQYVNTTVGTFTNIIEFKENPGIITIIYLAALHYYNPLC
jgi:hypothetical protein